MINIDYRDARPVYEQVKDEFKRLIIKGILKKDDQIPPVREIASTLAINPNTIQRAYKELETEGYIYSAKGRGTFVAEPPKAESTFQKEKTLQSFISALDELLFLGVTKEELEEILNTRAERTDNID